MFINKEKSNFEYEVFYFLEDAIPTDFKVGLDLSKKDVYKVYLSRNSEEKSLITYIISNDSITKGSYELLAGNLVNILEDDNKVKISLPKLSENDLLDYIIGLGMGCYSFDKYNKQKTNKNLLSFTLSEQPLLSTSIINDALIKIESINMARTLVNEPANVLNPTSYEDFILDRYKGNSAVVVEVIKGQDLIDNQFNGLYHVGKASNHLPKMIILSYQSNKEKELIALIGKGLTYDSGGMNLKTSRYVGNMKTDMVGSACMLGAFDTLVNIKADVNVKCYLPICENAISKDMQFSGDTITYPNGIIIEVGNTDAEGRLVLADALLKASEDGATTIIDAATLTGAMVAALGDQIAGVFSNDHKLAKKLVKISNKVNEPLWHMPIIKKYEQYLKSDHADYMNIALNAPGAGASTAASFLNLFIDNDKVKWAHLDIAGTAYTTKFNYLSKATGFGVKTITKFVLLNQ